MRYSTSSSSCFHDQPSNSSSSESFNFTIDNPPIDNCATEDLVLHPTSHNKSIIEASTPYSDARHCFRPIQDNPPYESGQTIHPSNDNVPAIPSVWSDLNFPVLDLFSRASGPSWSSFGLGDPYIKQSLPASRSPWSSHNTLVATDMNKQLRMSQRLQSSGNGTREGKRLSKVMEVSAPRIVFKKSRSDPHASCTPWKEKLGDRIAALQQLVAPYGKTDTASVLSEAIVYINFLQDQVEALSLPYVKFSRAWNEEKSERGLREDCSGSIEVKPKGELRRQGLCLVPLSCMSHIDFANFVGPIYNWPFPRVS